MTWGERTVEVPWMLNQIKEGSILDVGSAESCYINELLEKDPSRLVLNDIRNFSTHEQDNRVSCVVGDNRKLTIDSFGGEKFDNILCISTLEHVALEAYGQQKDYKNNPYNAQLEALVYMIDTYLKEDGQLILTIPYGKYEHGGWVIVYNKEAVDKIKKITFLKEEVYFTLTNRDKDTWKQVSANKCPLKGMDHYNGDMRATSVACLILGKK